MKSLFFLTLFLSASQTYATVVDCNGKKFFSSPYPGASSSANVILNIDDINEELSFSIRGKVSSEDKYFKLESFDHDFGRALIQFKGQSDSGEKISGSISYLNGEGVLAKIRNGRKNSFDYKCSIFRFKN